MTPEQFKLWLILVALAAFIAFVTFVVRQGLREDKNGEWHPHLTFLLFHVECIDGVKRTGALQRRWVNGRWQYRAETSQEGRDRIAN